MSLASPKILIKFLVLKTKSWCTAQGAQLGALWWPRGVGGSRVRGCMYTERCKESDDWHNTTAANWLCCTAEINNTVKQLYSKFKKPDQQKKEQPSLNTELNQ